MRNRVYIFDSKTWKKDLLRAAGFVLLVLLTLVSLEIDVGRLNPGAGYGRGGNAFISLLTAQLSPVGVSAGILGIFLLMVYYHEIFRRRRSFMLSALIPAILFSLFLLIGDGISVFHDFTFITLQKEQFAVVCIAFAGKAVLFYILLRLLFLKADEYDIWSFRTEGIPGWVQKYFFEICVIVLFICWEIPYAAYFPGSVPHDGRYQLNMFFHVMRVTTHHPVFSTVLFGVLYSAGSVFKGAGGTFLIVMFQMVCGAVVFSRICEYILKKTNMILALCSLAFYAFAPMWWTYMQAVIKDTLFFILFAAYSLSFVKMLNGDCGKNGLLELTCLAVLTYLFRNDGIFIILPSLVMLLILKRKQKQEFRKMAAAVFFTLGIFVLQSFMITRVLGIMPRNQVEALSVPLNQVANYVREYKDEITPEEAAVIDRIVLYEGIEERYNPELADPVKNKYKTNISREELSDFYSLYFRFLKRHPGAFAEEAVCISYGYFDPTCFFTGLSAYPLYNESAKSKYDMGIVYSEYRSGKELRDFAAGCANAWKKIPLLSLVVNPATYTWLIILVTAWLLRKQCCSKLCALAAPVLNILICAASPVNGLLRYELPVMAVIPLYLFVVCIPSDGSFKEAVSLKDGETVYGQDSGNAPVL